MRTDFEASGLLVLRSVAPKLLSESNLGKNAFLCLLEPLKKPYFYGEIRSPWTASKFLVSAKLIALPRLFL